MLNALSSVLTYTDMDLAAIQGKRKTIRIHQSTFVKQVIYFFIVLGIQIGLVSQLKINLEENFLNQKIEN